MLTRRTFMARAPLAALFLPAIGSAQSAKPGETGLEARIAKLEAQLAKLQHEQEFRQFRKGLRKAVRAAFGGK